MFDLYVHSGESDEEAKNVVGAFENAKNSSISHDSFQTGILCSNNFHKFIFKVIYFSQINLLSWIPCRLESE